MTTYDQARSVALQMRTDRGLKYLKGVGPEPDPNDENNWVIRAYITQDLYKAMSDNVKGNYYIDDVKVIFEVTGTGIVK